VDYDSIAARGALGKPTAPGQINISVP